MTMVQAIIGDALILVIAILGLVLIAARVPGRARGLGVAACALLGLQMITIIGTNLLARRLFRSGVSWVYGLSGAFSLLLGLASAILFIAAVVAGRPPKAVPPPPQPYPPYGSYPPGPGPYAPGPYGQQPPPG